MAISIPVSGFDGWMQTSPRRLEIIQQQFNVRTITTLALTCTLRIHSLLLALQYWSRAMFTVPLMSVMMHHQAANASRHPELGGHVVAEETRDFWRCGQSGQNSYGQ
jgi:hypothetical protein